MYNISQGQMYSVTAKNGKKEKSFMLDTDTPTVCFKSILVLQTAYSNHMYWLFFFLFFFLFAIPLEEQVWALYKRNSRFCFWLCGIFVIHISPWMSESHAILYIRVRRCGNAQLVWLDFCKNTLWKTFCFNNKNANDILSFKKNGMVSFRHASKLDIN